MQTPTMNFPAWLAVPLLAMAVLFLQIESGAYSAEMGGHPDEAAHFVTGLMVRDYIAGGFLQTPHPLHYAQAYYDHYPKVALGHYPPGFYAVEAVWTLVFGSSVRAILILLALIAWAWATLAWSVGKSLVGPFPAFAAALVLVLLPIAQRYTSLVMSDTLLALCILAAVAAYGRWMERGGWSAALIFGIAASIGTLTKASGLMLALLPPLALLLAGRLGPRGIIALVSDWTFWLPVPIVGLLCAPWFLLTRHMADEGMVHEALWPYLQKSVPYLLGSFASEFGLLILALAALGLWGCRTVTCLQTDKTAAPAATLPPAPFLPPMWAALAALPAVLTVFYAVLPTGFDERYVLPAAPCVLLLAVAGVTWGVGKISLTGVKLPLDALVLAILGVGLALTGLRIPPKVCSGFGYAVEAASGPGVAASDEILVSSDANGEGALIAETAIADGNLPAVGSRRPARTIQRGTKVLSESDWMGRGYQAKFATPAELAAWLHGNDKIRWIVWDGLAQSPLPHHAQLAEALSDGGAAAGFHLATRVTARRRDAKGEILVYGR